MNVNFNNIHTTNTMATQSLATVAEAAKDKATNTDSYEFTVSLAESAIEDIQASSIPENTFKRDDDLGKLVSAAFSLAPPPFPAVE